MDTSNAFKVEAIKSKVEEVSVVGESDCNR